MLRYFDAHSHIHGKEYDLDRAEVLSRMRENGVGTITVGTHLESSKRAVALAEREGDVWATVGLHPTDTKDKFDYQSFKELAVHPRVVAIGECGLDYFRLGENAENEKRRQEKIFLEQVTLALEVGKPLMVHCRPSGKTMDAHEDMLAILTEKKKEHGDKLRGNIHFFTGTMEVANKYFELGFTISFPGVITFTNEYDQLVRDCPLSMILSETDAPYASPEPFRGKRNEPAYVLETVRKIAELKSKSEEEIAARIIENVKRVFGLSV